MQHNVELFLSSELRHSPKRNVKLLGREQRSDFHHDRTTPLEACGSSFSPVSFSLTSESFDLSEASFQSEWQYAKSFGNYVRVSSYLWMWRAPYSWLRGYKPPFAYSFNLSLVQNRRLSGIIDFLFHRSSRTTHSLIPEGLRICRRIQCWKLGCIPTFALEFYSRAFRYLLNSVSRWLLILWNRAVNQAYRTTSGLNSHITWDM